MKLIQVGQVDRNSIKHSDGVEFDIHNSGIMIRLWFEEPTYKEVTQISRGHELSMKLLSSDGVVFALMKFGDLQWMDAPYDVHISEDLEQNINVGTIKDFPVVIQLFDAKTGELVVLRMIQMEKSFYERLNDVMQEQWKNHFNKFDLIRKILLQQEKSTNEMVSLAGRTYQMEEEIEERRFLEFDISKKLLIPADEFEIRKSLEGIIPKYIKKVAYEGLPDELEKYHYWIADRGHIITAIPECLFKEAVESGDLYYYEKCVPCSYVMEKGYRFYNGHVVVEIPYNDEYGIADVEYDW